MTQSNFQTVKNIIDFIPQSDITGDLLRITDTKPAATNTKVQALVHMLEMFPATLMEVPDAGLHMELHSLFGEQDATPVLKILQDRIESHTDLKIVFSSEKDKFDPGLVLITGVVQNLPGRVKFQLKREGSVAKIISPRYVV